MDEDTKMIEELRANCEYQKNHILQLERALKQEIAKREDIKKLTNDELQKSNEIIHDLKQKLTSCMSALESKNIELVNLQTALGQYYAESEAKVIVNCFVHALLVLIILFCYFEIDILSTEYQKLMLGFM